MKKWDIAIALGLLITFFTTAVWGFADTCQEIREEVLRVHILANSDSPEDQQRKLLVRDAVLEECADLFQGDGTLEEAEAKAVANLERLEEVANRTLRQAGSQDTAQAQLVNMYFNTREYEEFTMPAGYYDAVRITIGKGEGKNWWCVMFPSMCLPAADDKLKGFTPAQQQLIGEKPAFEPRFALVEWWEGRKAAGTEETAVKTVDIPHSGGYNEQSWEYVPDRTTK